MENNAPSGAICRAAAFLVLPVVGTLLPWTTAGAGGYLWMGAALAEQGTIYRYNIDSATIDLVLEPSLPPGATHFNNMACDGATLFVGTPDTQYLGTFDAQSGAFLGSTTYSPALSGTKKDGAVHPVTGNLWRMTSSSLVHQTTPAGALVSTSWGAGDLIGAEWIGNTLYATAAGGVFGRVELPVPGLAAFVPILWTPGGAPSGSTLGALAYDGEASNLYLVTYDDQRLWTIAINGILATATLVVDLNDVGMPPGVLVEGMGWVAAASQPCPADLDGDGAVDGADLGLLLGAWNVAGGDGDMSGDGVVNGADLGLLLGAWGPCAG